MKTLLLTLVTAVFAMTFSSCCHTSNKAREINHYDGHGRLVKKDLHSGNYNTYHYETESKKTPNNANKANKGSWKPTMPKFLR